MDPASSGGSKRTRPTWCISLLGVGRYRFVSVRVPFENGDAQVLDVTAKLPDKVDVVAIVAVIVPPSWPTHAGSAGMPPGPTEIV